MNVLVFAGSAREGSLNKKLAAVLATKLEAKGAEVSLIDLKDYPMPLYDGDFEDEHKEPEHAGALKALFRSHDALAIASPEYNSSITPLLKNTLDWVSRKGKDPKDAPSPFAGKKAILVACSPGALGGMRALNHVRDILFNVGVTVLPGSVAVGNGFKVFDEAGQLTDERTDARLDGLVEGLLDG